MRVSIDCERTCFKHTSHGQAKMARCRKDRATLLVMMFASSVALYQLSWRSALTGRLLLETSTSQATIFSRARHQLVLAPLQGSRAVDQVYQYPKLIHQTIRNKSEITCSQQRNMNSWRRLNPGFQLKLWDDQDIRAFVNEHYPELMPTPFDDFLSGVERSDFWRVLVLHKFGGVYADMDVQCLKPIEEWNMEHGLDAQVLLGMENYDSNRKHPIHVVNWVLAAVPGHPLLGSMPEYVARATQRQFFELMRKGTTHSSMTYEAGIIDRTGPAVLSWAMYEYFERLGVNMSAVSDKTLAEEQGFMAGGVRVLPIVNMGLGWEVFEAQQQNLNHSCESLGEQVPSAYVCHMFKGSWKSNWRVRESSDCSDTLSPRS